MKSPCQTPRSTDKSNRDLRSADGNSNSFNKSEKEKGVNIQVIVRCRCVRCFQTILVCIFELNNFVMISDHLTRRRRGYKRLRCLPAMTGKRKWRWLRILLGSRLIRPSCLTRFNSLDCFCCYACISCLQFLGFFESVRFLARRRNRRTCITKQFLP